MYSNFGDPKARDRDLGILKPRKNGNFGVENYFN